MEILAEMESFYILELLVKAVNLGDLVEEFKDIQGPSWTEEIAQLSKAASLTLFAVCLAREVWHDRLA